MVFMAIIIAIAAAAKVISAISNTAEIRQEMMHRRQAAGNEQGVDLARVGKTPGLFGFLGFFFGFFGFVGVFYPEERVFGVFQFQEYFKVHPDFNK